MENRTILLIAVIYTVVITALFLMPSSDLPKISLPSNSDKIVHLLIHGSLVGIWLFYLSRRENGEFLFKHAVVVVLGSVLFGIVIELLQEQLTVSRTADFYDVLANLSGALLGVLLFRIMRSFFTS